MTAAILLATLDVGCAVLRIKVRRARRSRVVQNLTHLDPVRLRDGLRASKAAQAAATADGCVWCDELPCQAGAHWSWAGWVTPDDVRRANPSPAQDVRWIWDELQGGGAA